MKLKSSLVRPEASGLSSRLAKSQLKGWLFLLQVAFDEIKKFAGSPRSFGVVVPTGKSQLKGWLFLFYLIP
jgi:hypothetical protein